MIIKYFLEFDDFKEFMQKKFEFRVRDKSFINYILNYIGSPIKYK